jgi:heme/copper-type cytochrome/quinol oxidase subunit 2
MTPDGRPAESEGRERRRTAREAERGSRRVEIQWIVVPAIIAVVFVIGFGLRFLLT